MPPDFLQESGESILRRRRTMKRSRSTEEQTVETLREQESEVNALFIEPDLPWKDEYNESFSTNLRGGRMNGDPFNDLWDAAILIARAVPLQPYASP